MTPRAERAGGWNRARGRAVLPVAALFLLLAACGGDAGPQVDEGLTPAEFVDVMVALREAERSVMPEDSAAPSFDQRKAEILERHHVTEPEIQRFVRTHGGDFELMDAVWDSITQRLRYVPADTPAAPAPITEPEAPDTAG